MSQISTLAAEARDGVGKGAARSIRRQGKVPGVIYGNKQTSVSIAVEPRALWAEMNKPGFLTRLFDITVNGKNERVLCRDVQCHPVTDQPLHVDFLRVSSESKVHVHVPVHFANQDASPGIKRGGVLNIVAHEIEVVAPATDIPEAITIDLAGLDIGTSVHLSQIALPEGVTIVAHDKNQTIAAISAPTVATAADTAADAAPAAEAVAEKPAS